MYMRFSSFIVKAITLFLFSTASAFAQETIPFPEKIEQQGFRGVIAKTGNIYISGQPDSAALEWLKAQGVTTVINLRTQGEMDNRQYVPYDEESFIKNLQLQYVHIPLGGDDTPYNPQAVKKFADAVDKAEGKVLLHCTVAWRASHMWAAYLIKYKKIPVDEAISNAKGINFGTLPLEGLLGKDLKIDVEN